MSKVQERVINYIKSLQYNQLIIKGKYMNINTLSTLEKRQLVNQLRALIKEDLAFKKSQKVLSKVRKENERKDKLQKSIIAAQEKLAKLQAKLAV